MAVNRVRQLQQRLGDSGIGALVVTSPVNIRYLSGFTGSNGFLMVTNDSATLVTDRRYEERASEEIGERSIAIQMAPGDGLGSLRELVPGSTKIGLEAAHISWKRATELEGALGQDRLVPVAGVVEALRERKDPSEIARIRQAAKIADVALADAIESLIPGSTERSVAQSFERSVVEQGADGVAFETIVASGTNGSRPHHATGERELEMGDLVIIDCGAMVDGYRSDMTRSFVLGQPTARQVELLDAVRDAQAVGVAAAGPGVVTAEIDRACRASLETSSLARWFTHGAGHGVGLDIHEAPAVNANATATLAPGHVITVEPGVYLPGEGGVRWEDTVVITDGGAEPVTLSPKQPVLLD